MITTIRLESIRNLSQDFFEQFNKIRDTPIQEPITMFDAGRLDRAALQVLNAIHKFETELSSVMRKHYERGPVATE